MYRRIDLDDVDLQPEFDGLMKVNQALLSSLNLAHHQLQELFNPEIRSSVHEPMVQNMFAFIQGLSGKKVIVCGDYDCDGVLSTSLLVKFCRSLNIEVGFYIPNRISEGYGVGLDTVKLAIERGYEALICVDNGVSAQSELSYAKAHGLAVGIIDHHLIGDEPVCDVLLHPDGLSGYYKGMCATGLVALLFEQTSMQDEVLAMACVGTIGDMMELWGKNREFVRTGLDVLNRKSFACFDALRNDQLAYTAQSIAFQIVPKINAVGRLSNRANPNNLVRYFCDLNDNDLRSFASQVNKVNDLRKTLTRNAMGVAQAKIKDEAIIIVEDESFHEGIVGIIAGQLSAQYHRPAIVLTTSEHRYKGSGRSQTISLHHLLSRADSAWLTRFGGHAQAAGVEVAIEGLDAFRKNMLELMADEPQIADDHVVYVIDPTSITVESMRELSRFEPYGQGFQLPTVLCELQGKPVRLGQVGYKWVMPTLEFAFFGQLPAELISYQRTYVVGSLRLNQFRSKQTVQLVISDFMSEGDL